MAHLTDKIIKGFDEGLLTGMVLIDLYKAFDTIIHKVWFQKYKTIRFSEQHIQWFRAYLCDQIFLIETESKLSDFRKIFCEVPQGSILEPNLFLFYVNDMHQAVKSNLLQYSDDSSLMYQQKVIAKIEQILNQNVKNICDQFVNKKLSIHFGYDKTKSIFFVNKRKFKNFCKLNIRYKVVNIKQ